MLGCQHSCYNSNSILWCNVYFIKKNVRVEERWEPIDYDALVRENAWPGRKIFKEG